jgi:hypothetical protein
MFLIITADSLVGGWVGHMRGSRNQKTAHPFHCAGSINFDQIIQVENTRRAESIAALGSSNSPPRLCLLASKLCIPFGHPASPICSCLFKQLG